MIPLAMLYCIYFFFYRGGIAPFKVAFLAFAGAERGSEWHCIPGSMLRTVSFSFHLAFLVIYVMAASEVCSLQDYFHD